MCTSIKQLYSHLLAFLFYRKISFFFHIHIIPWISFLIIVMKSGSINSLIPWDHKWLGFTLSMLPKGLSIPTFDSSTIRLLSEDIYVFSSICGQHGTQHSSCLIQHDTMWGPLQCWYTHKLLVIFLYHAHKSFQHR